MALINCPECNGEVSSTATTCIHCGHTLIKKKTVVEKIISNKKVAISIICLVVVIGLYVVFAHTTFNMSENERIALHAVDKLQANLLDPDSLKIYEAYVDDNSGTLLHFSARTTGGGMCDNWSYVDDKQVCFETDFGNDIQDDIEERGRSEVNSLLQSSLIVSLSKAQIEKFGTDSPNTRWKTIDADKLNAKIK